MIITHRIDGNPAAGVIVDYRRSGFRKCSERSYFFRKFESSRAGVIAGCRVTDGQLRRGARMVVLREGEEVFEGTLESLRHFDEDVSTINAPQECGVAGSEFRRWQEGDIIQAYIQEEVPRTLGPAGDSTASSGS